MKFKDTKSRDSHAKAHVGFHVFDWFKVNSQDVVRKVSNSLFPHSREMSVDQLDHTKRTSSNHTSSDDILNNFHVAQSRINTTTPVNGFNPNSTHGRFTEMDILNISMPLNKVDESGIINSTSNVLLNVENGRQAVFNDTKGVQDLYQNDSKTSDNNSVF